MVTPVTTPPPLVTVATAGRLELHVPPALASLNVVVKPIHTFMLPVMVAGNGLTVMIAILAQPVAGSVTVSVPVPTLLPNINPEALPPDNIAPVALHAPPAVASVKVAVKPKHTVMGPVIGAGTGFTVNTAVVWHPVGEGNK